MLRIDAATADTDLPTALPAAAASAPLSTSDVTQGSMSVWYRVGRGGRTIGEIPNLVSMGITVDLGLIDEAVEQQISLGGCTTSGERPM